MTTVASFVESLPAEYVLADPAALEGRVTTAGGEDSPADRARSLLASADELELLTPVVSSAYADALRSAVFGGASVHVVVTGDASTALTGGRLAMVRPLLESRPSVTLSIHDGAAPFAVLLAEERVAIARPDDDGDVEALYESEGEAARAWARDVFDTFAHEAES